MSYFWTAERTKAVADLWAQGLSASEIAKQLGRGVTRNAVIGKVHRLGLSGRERPSRPSRVASPPQLVRPARPDEQLERLKVLFAQGLTYAQITEQTGIPRSTAALKLRQAGFRRGRLKTSIVKSKAPSAEVRKVTQAACASSFSDAPDSKPLTERRFGECAWPVGVPSRPAFQHCCARPASDGSSYCAEHRAIGVSGQVMTAKELIRSVRRAA